MHALIIIAHGSRRSASNDEIRELVMQLKTMAHGFAHIEAAFLELTEPSINSACEALIAKGCTKISCLPYFLAAGNHIIRDIPGIIAELREKHPDTDITQLAYIGAHPEMPNLLLKQIQAAN